MSLFKRLMRLLPFGSKQTPLFIQMETTECGAACLKIILEYYGRYVPIDELRTACGVSRDGCTAYGVATAAEKYGMECDGYSFTLEELKEQPLPCIVYWGFDHFVVLEKISKGKYYINDPAVGHIALDEADFKRLFTGVILLLKPNADFKRGGEKAGFMDSLRKRIGSVYTVIGVLILMQFGLVFLTLVMTLLSQIFVDYILTARFPLWWLWFIGIASGTGLAILLLTFLQNVVLVKTQIKLTTLYSADFFKHLFELPVDFYEQRYSSEIAYRSTLNQQVASFMTGHLFEAAIQIFTLVVYGTALFFFSIPIAITTILCGSLNLLTVYMIHRRRLSIYSRYRQDIGKAASFSISALEGFETWKCLGIENRLFSWLAALYTKSFNVLHELQNTDQLLGNMSYISQVSANAFLFVIGGWSLMAGGLTPGQFTALLLLVGLFMKPTTRLVDINRNFELFQVDLARLNDVMDHPVDRKFSEPAETEAREFKGNIEFHDVTYSYNINHPPILNGINLSIEKGRRVALVGATGSGKTTLVKLLAGFIVPEAGTIKIDGVDLQNESFRFLSSHMAFVFDTPFIFADTVKTNMTLYDSSYTNDQIRNATQDACLSERFNDWGMGEMLEEEGKNISGGEKQRLEIARSLLQNPSFLVLDEATSALDVETERKVIENIKKRNCGMLILTHRLSAISQCDEVYVLQGGSIVQKGTPQQLSIADGPFKKMLLDEPAKEL